MMVTNQTFNLEKLFVRHNPILYWKLPKLDKRGNEIRTRTLVHDLFIGRNLEAFQEVAEAVKRGDADLPRLGSWLRVMNASAAAEAVEAYRKDIFDTLRVKGTLLADSIKVNEKELDGCEKQLRELEPKLADLAAAVGIVLDTDAPIRLEQLGVPSLDLIAAENNLPGPVEPKDDGAVSAITSATSGIAWGWALGFATEIMEPSSIADNPVPAICCALMGMSVVFVMSKILRARGRSAGDHAYLEGVEDKARMRRLRLLHVWGFAGLAIFTFVAGWTLESFAFHKATVEATSGNQVSAAVMTGRIIATILTGMTVAYYSSCGWDLGYNAANLRNLKLKLEAKADEFRKSPAFRAMIAPATVVNRLLKDREALQTAITSMQNQMDAGETEEQLRRIDKLEVDVVRYGKACELDVAAGPSYKPKRSFWAWLRGLFSRRTNAYPRTVPMQSVGRNDRAAEL